MTLTLYGDRKSGNCLKVKWALEKRAIPYAWIDVDVMAAETRTPEFLALNPSGQVPVIRLDDGRTLSQSNAIIAWLAEVLSPVPAYQHLVGNADIRLDGDRATGRIPADAPLVQTPARNLPPLDERGNPMHYCPAV